jgi:hypothetical protein
LQFSVGSYLLARFDVSQIPSNSTIFALRLSLVQSLHTVPIDEFIADNLTEDGTEHKPEDAILSSMGQVPKSARPKSDASALWRGSDVPGSSNKSDQTLECSVFRWETGKLRIPDEKVVRPSTSEG